MLAVVAMMRRDKGKDIGSISKFLLAACMLIQSGSKKVKIPASYKLKSIKLFWRLLKMQYLCFSIEPRISNC